MRRGAIGSGKSLSLFRRGTALTRPAGGRLATHPWSSAFVCVFLLAGGGCAFGPKVLERTHGRYYESIRLVNEQEFLRNLIHLRYNEYPLP